MMVEAVIVGGTDTTRNQLGCAVALLADHPEQWRPLADQPELAPRAVEELMRYFGAVRGTGRFASEDIVYRDVLFPAGTFVAPSMATANFDRAVFPDADRFDITKEPAGTAAADVRLGDPLLPRAPRWPAPSCRRRCRCSPAGCPTSRLDGPVTWKPNTVGIFGPEHLPVRFTPGH